MIPPLLNRREIEQLIPSSKYKIECNSFETNLKHFDNIQPLPLKPIKLLELPPVKLPELKLVEIPAAKPKKKKLKKKEPLRTIELPAVTIYGKKEQKIEAPKIPITFTQAIQPKSDTSLLRYTGEKIQLLSLTNLVRFIPRIGKSLQQILLWINFDIRFGISHRNVVHQTRSEIEIKLPIWMSGTIAYCMEYCNMKKSMIAASFMTLLLQNKKTSPKNTRKCIKLKFSNSLSYIKNWILGKADRKDSSYQIGIAIDSEIIKKDRYRMTVVNGVEILGNECGSRSFYSGIKHYFKPIKNGPEIEINSKCNWFSETENSKIPSIF